MTELRRSLAGGKCDAWFVMIEENCAVKTSARKGDDMKQLNGRQSSRLQKQRHARQSDSDNIIGKVILTGKIELSGTHQHIFSPRHGLYITSTKEKGRRNTSVFERRASEAQWGQRRLA